MLFLYAYLKLISTKKVRGGIGVNGLNSLEDIL